MNKTYEIEVKFFLDNRQNLEKRIQTFGAELLYPRIFETNLRFDTPEGELTNRHEVLRLRKDTISHLTYKGPASDNIDVSIRREIEFQVSDFEAASAFLEALGYQVRVKYEKFRTTYRLENCLVVLDEMPYGDFVEIEAANISLIKSLAKKLHLVWERRCLESYLALFERVRQRRALNTQHLTFIELAGLTFSADDFGLSAADQ